MKNEQCVYSCDDLQVVASDLVDKLRLHSVMTFTGPLGAGKTTLIKKMLHLYGVDQLVTSPTFTYVNRYVNSAGQIVYHFDLYRIKTANDFFDAGFDEYLYDTGAKIIIEWPAVIAHFLPLPYWSINIDYAPLVHERLLSIVQVTEKD